MAPGSDDAIATSEEALHDRGLLALWYIRLRLEQELDRSRRAGHPLAVILLSPNPPLGGRAPEEALTAAAVAVSASARRADLVGWLDADTIVVVLPDSDDSGARQAAQRWKNQIWLKTMHMGSVKWEAFVLVNAAVHASTDEVLKVALAGQGRLLRPPR